MTHTDQGNLGEAIAICELSKLGYSISIPLHTNLPYDLVADKDGVLYRVQVKSTSVQKDGKWNVFIATSGGNTKLHTRKGFDSSRCDYIFVVAGGTQFWFIPTSIITAKDYLTVGTDKYREYQI